MAQARKKPQSKKQKLKKAAPKKSAAKKKTPPPFVSTGFWLLKSEPESYSIEAFEKDQSTLWTGVRNYQARNFMMTSMKPGDQFLFYHSNAEPAAVVGTGKILSVNRPDPTAWDENSIYHDPKSSSDHPIWFCAEVGFASRMKTPVSLQMIRSRPELAKMTLLQPGQRLSVLPVQKDEFEMILKMGR